MSHKTRAYTNASLYAVHQLIKYTLLVV